MDTGSTESAHIRIEVAASSACGGAADGVLGCTAAAGEVTLIQGWEWYASSDASSINQNQFDFQTIVTHEGYRRAIGPRDGRT